MLVTERRRVLVEWYVRYGTPLRRDVTIMVWSLDPSLSKSIWRTSPTSIW
ncbi:hypothetical protein SMICM17S_11285 [Streptomyces microflavus]